MSLSTQVAWKYFFKRKKNHFINYISVLSVTGLTIGLTVLLLVGSVFNGFESLLLSMFQQTNPDLYVTSYTGKTLSVPPRLLEEISREPGVEAAAPVINETILFSYENNNLVAALYGVPENYFSVVDLRPYLSIGEMELYREGVPQLILGSSLKRNLGVVIHDPYTQVETYFPGKSGPSLLGRELLKKQTISASGTFSVVQEGGSGHAYAPVEFVRQLIGYPDTLYTGLQIKLASPQDEKKVREALIKKFPHQEITIQNQYQQDEDLYKLMNIEKWIGFIIVIFTIVLIAFNLVGCIWMIVIEKSDNFRILSAMGAGRRDISAIIFKLGGFFGMTSIVLGTLITLIIYVLHKRFGLLSMGEGMIIDAYPSELEVIDFAVAYSVVTIVCFLAAWPAARRAVNLSFKQKK